MKSNTEIPMIKTIYCSNCVHFNEQYDKSNYDEFCFNCVFNPNISSHYYPKERIKRQVNIIYLSGKAHSGKSTAAKYISENYHFDEYAYADNLKQILKYAGWNGIKDVNGRKLLQAVGKAFRDYDEDYWIKQLVNNNDDFICNFWDSYKRNIIISDCRHVNELENFEKILLEDSDLFIQNSVKIKIVRNNNIDDDSMNENTKKDISEISLDEYNKFDYIIENNNSLEKLYNEIDNIMTSKNLNMYKKQLNNCQ